MLAIKIKYDEEAKEDERMRRKTYNEDDRDYSLHVNGKPPFITAFDMAINSFIYYNCQLEETGKTCHFYIK